MDTQPRSTTAHHHHDVRKYTIGWLCALPVELAAAKLSLDRRHDGLWLNPSDGMEFTLGSIGNHNVVIGCLPAGETGIGAAATVATRMREKFPNMQFGLMVGIGGGVPTEKDVRLGDVVVSQPVGTSSSVVQYDLGKSTPQGFIRTGFLNAPPQILRQALTNLQARHMCEENNMPTYLANIERIPAFKRPPPESDILFNSAYDHVEPRGTCESCNKSEMKPRKTRESNKPEIHYGTIASGNKVIKDARERDLLGKELDGVLCVEMEAAGLMNNFNCLVIRGIADYADSHKNDQWHPYAAAVASAFTKDLLVDVHPIALSKPATGSIWIDEAFQSAQTAFMIILRDIELEDFVKCQTMEDIYDVTDSIQSFQAASEELVALSRIKPYLERVDELLREVEKAMGRKEVVLIIWDSLKLLLQIFSTIDYAFDSIITAISEVGRALPLLKEYSSLFERSEEVKDVLALFYQEILDLQIALLNTFKKKNTKLVFQSVWPKADEKIQFFKGNINRYRTLISEHVTTEEVSHHCKLRRSEYRAMQEDYSAQVYSNYQNVVACLSPRFYEAELDKFQRESAPNSGDWLYDNSDFKRWLDPDDFIMRTIWLQGIPGAGKTILMANSVLRLKLEHQVLFAFLSFDDKVYNSAVKVLQSLMFQFINRHPSLCSILHERFIFDTNQLNGSLSYVENLFTDLIRDSGVTLMALDGVDEIDEIERKDLLGALLRLMVSCRNIKLLVSSRMETDITALLKNKAFAIRVDHSNSKDIESYVDARYKLWLPDLQSYSADESTCSQIQQALTKVKEKANGMFLYVKLVLFVVTSQDNLPDIQKEVTSLPDGLGQAYDRILKRIQNSSTLGDKLAALTVLQWIGCATRPLSEQELLQVLAVQQHDSNDFSKGRKALRNIQHTCGPFIEIEQGTVRFVHFTAKEYIFGAQSNNFVRAAKAHWMIAVTCIKYLCFPSFNGIFSETITDADMEHKLLAGDFILFEYAVTQWIHHVAQSARSMEPQFVGLLCNNIQEFYSTRKNNDSTPHFIQPSAHVDFTSFEQWPDIQGFLSRVQGFQTRLEEGLLNTDGIESTWKNFDPTKGSVALIRLQKQIEGLLCQNHDHQLGCRCKEIKELYGENRYRCDRHFCQFYMTGFRTRAERDEHLKVHSRPHKCPNRDCVFSELGFQSQSEVKRHCSKTHPPSADPKSQNLSGMLIHQSSNDDMRALLLDAVRHDNCDAVSYLLENKAKPDSLSYSTLQSVAARHTSARMVMCVRDHAKLAGTLPDIEEAVQEAIGAENVLVLRAIITEADLTTVQEAYITSKINNICKGRLEIAFTVCNTDIMDVLIDHSTLELPSVCPEDLFKDFLLSKMSENEKQRRFYAIAKYVRWPEAYTEAVFWAGVAGSTTMVQACLELGGSVNAAKKSSSKGPARSVLYRCVLKGSNRHAEVVKLLLLKGANLEEAPSFRVLKGMERIERYFGISWDELVEQTRGDSH